MSRRAARLPGLYFKQGDDLASHLADKHASAGSPGQEHAMRAWAEQLGNASRIVGKVADRLEAVGWGAVEVHADTHYVALSPLSDAGQAIIDRLVRDGVLEYEDTEECTNAVP